MTESFADLLRECIPDDTSEERWAYEHGLNPRLLRRLKRARTKLQAGTLSQLVTAMRALRGTEAKRAERILAATAPDAAATTRRPSPARPVRAP